MQHSLHRSFMKKIIMFVNSRSRQGDSLVDEIKTWLNDNGFELLNPTFDPQTDKIEEVIKRHAAEEPIVMVGGGDGTVNKALPALLESRLPLMVIPLGTANNLARTLKLPTDPKEALNVLKEGREQQVDVGVANEIPFMNVIGLGLSTQINRTTPKDLKRWFGVFAFILTAMKVIPRISPFRIEIQHDDQTHRAYTWQISVCNGRNYGNGLVIHQDANLKDGTLHGLSTEVKKWWQAFALIPALLTGRFRTGQDITILSGKTMTLKTKRPMSVDVDGDVKTKTPVKVYVKESALRVLVPAEAAKSER